MQLCKASYLLITLTQLVALSNAVSLTIAPYTKLPGQNELSIGGSLKGWKDLELKEDFLRSIAQFIIHRIDKDGDEKIAYVDLRDWIRHVAKVGAERMTLLSWNTIANSKQKHINWTDYLTGTYGTKNIGSDELANSLYYRRQIRNNKRRWLDADVDRDGKLNFGEYLSFLHPHMKPHMRDTVISELIEAIDQDGNNLISESEYLHELARAYNTPLFPSLPQSSWVEKERRQFRNFLDYNQNGELDREEVGEWILPLQYDETEAEAQYLMQKIDKNGDSVLSKEEIFSQVSLFLRSQVTDYGKAMEYYHEL